MFAKERQETIIELLKRNKSVKVSQLTKRFQVSLETIRRDLEFLEKEGLIKRVHGGAVLEETTSHETTFIERETIHIEEKKKSQK